MGGVWTLQKVGLSFFESPSGTCIAYSALFAVDGGSCAKGSCPEDVGLVFSFIMILFPLVGVLS